ncbi:MAG: alpha/beta fold hydrolase [Bacteroidia bacterium]|nr:alpha/beta fold hydrolase [Bacteroidia bacterium]
MKLHYKKYGEGPVNIFILHGIFGMLDNWHNIARSMGDSYTIYTVDARNHGQSPHSDEMSYSLMASDLSELLNELKIEEAVIIGHSMGGKTAMVFAHNFPEKTKALVIVDIAPKTYKPGHVSYFKAFEEIDFSKLTNRKEVDEALMPYENDLGVRLFLAKNIERDEEGGFKVKSNLKGIRNGYEEIIGGLTFRETFEKPTLFIKGSRSAYISEYDEVEILKYFPKAAFEVVDNAGHWVNADNPEGFIKVLTVFLSQLK